MKRLVRLADILLIVLTIGAFILTYVENIANECFDMGSFILATSIFAFSTIYGRWLRKR